jgi:hypothetical protein
MTIFLKILCLATMKEKVATSYPKRVGEADNVSSVRTCVFQLS